MGPAMVFLRSPCPRGMAGELRVAVGSCLPGQDRAVLRRPLSPEFSVCSQQIRTEILLKDTSVLTAPPLKLAGDLH